MKPNPNILIAGLCLALVLACVSTATPTPYPPTPSATPSISPTPGITLTLIATHTPTPTPTETPVLTATPTATGTLAPPPTPTKIFVDGENRFINPDFEGEYREYVIWSPTEDQYIRYLLAPGWQPFHCGIPYTPEECLAPRQCKPNDVEGEGCNPAGTLMRRPEYKPIAGVEPYNGENAVQWFCMFGTCQAGVYQTIPTTPGEVCTVGAWVREWYNYDNDVESDIESPDDVIASKWKIRVSATGETFAFLDENLHSGTINIPEDEWVWIEYTFVAQSISATVFFENKRLWPIPNNDSYIDGASAYCEPPEEVEIDKSDEKLLARLCLAECRGFGDARDDCCLSVISTALGRVGFYEETRGAYALSDGTLYGTLAHYTISEGGWQTWQFPPWVSRGCDGLITEACLDNYPLDWALDVIRRYEAGERGSCDGYLYYDSIPGGNVECAIEGPLSTMDFHSGWGWEPVPD